MSTMRNLKAMQRELQETHVMNTLQLNHKPHIITESVIIETTPGSRLIKDAILTVYNAQEIKDAWAAKITITHWLQGRTTIRPASLSHDNAIKVFEAANTNPMNLDIALNELKYNDHFLLEIMQSLMTDGKKDAYEARKEMLAIVRDKQEPTYLKNNAAYLEKLKGLSSRNIGPLEIQYASHDLRIAVVETMTHSEGLTPRVAFDFVCMATGDELNQYLQDRGVKLKSEKVEVVEEKHHHHDDDVEDASEKEQVAKPIVQPVVTQPTASVVVTPVVEAPKPQQQTAIEAPKASTESSYAPYVVGGLVAAAIVYGCKQRIAGSLVRFGILHDAKKHKDGQDEVAANDMDLENDSENHTLVGKKIRTPVHSRNY